MDCKSETWTCEKCTLVNHRQDKLCSLCRCPKEIKLPTLPPELPMPDMSQIPSDRTRSPWTINSQAATSSNALDKNNKSNLDDLNYFTPPEVDENNDNESADFFNFSGGKINSNNMLSLNDSESSSDEDMDLYESGNTVPMAISTTVLKSNVVSVIPKTLHNSKITNENNQIGVASAGHSTNILNLNDRMAQNIDQFSQHNKNNNLTATTAAIATMNSLPEMSSRNLASVPTMKPAQPTNINMQHGNIYHAENNFMITNTTACTSQATTITTASKSLQISEPVPSNQWKCEFCTYYNRITAQYCEVCLQPPETKSIVQTLDTGDRGTNSQSNEQPKPKAFMPDWNCIKCSFANNPSRKECEICHSPRPDGFHSIPIAGREVFNLEDMELGIHNVQQPEAALASYNSATSSLRQEMLPDNSFPNHFSTNSIGPCSFESINIEQKRKDDERKIREQYRNITDICRQGNFEYVDSDFPPNDKNLWFRGSTNHKTVFTKWNRPRNIDQIGSGHLNWVVFRGHPKPSDIQQGILGNCWFLSALAVLAERPELLEKVVVTKEVSEQGVYIIQLYKDGILQSVVIDDVFPCNNNNTLLFSQAKRKQLWVPLVEKAMAKLNGVYEALQAGRSIEGLYALTGAACDSLQITGTDDMENETIWAKLLSCREAGFLMGASCGGSHIPADEGQYRNAGLRTRHAYSLLDVRDEQLRDGSHIRLLKLRNPWGQRSWTGDWSQNNFLWDEEHRLRRNLRDASYDEGTFWINFKDFQRYFDSVDICKIRGPEWTEARITGRFPNTAQVNPDIFLLRVYDMTSMDITVFLKGNSRSTENGLHQPVDMTICVFQTDHNATEQNAPIGRLIVSSKRQVKRHNHCEHMFPPGNYVVVCTAFNHWLSCFASTNAAAVSREEDYPQFVMAFHGNKPIAISRAVATENTLADAIIQLTMKQGDGKEVRECATCYYLTKGWGGLIVVAENRHPSRHMQIQCDCQDSRNIVSTREQLLFKDSLPPLHRQVIINLTQLDGLSGYTVTHRLTHRMGGMGLGDWSSIPNVNHYPELGPDVYNLHKPRPL